MYMHILSLDTQKTHARFVLKSMLDEKDEGTKEVAKEYMSQINSGEYDRWLWNCHSS